MNEIQITALMPTTVLIPYVDFPGLLTAHLSRNPKTPAIEATGAFLRDSPTIKLADLDAFIKDVCGWGNYSGIHARVMKENSSRQIEVAFADAIYKLKSTPLDIVGAMDSMLNLKELGVSFSSKHLRFLFPEHCAVLDSILSERLLYDLSSSSYGEFCGACEKMATELNQARIPCPFPGAPNPVWRPSDVEAALFAWANNWK